MADLRKARKNLFIATAILLVIDVIATVLLLTPLAGRESLRQDEMQQLWANLKSRQSAPWRGIDKKIPEAKKEIASFYQDRIPSGYSAISTNLDQLAAQTGVRVSSEKYKQGDTDIHNLQQVEVDADVSGDYLQLVKFINAVERNKLFFIVQDLELGGEQNGVVRLTIKLQTFLRTA